MMKPIGPQSFYKSTRSEQSDVMPRPGSVVFPVTRSILSPEALAAEVAQAYAIDRPMSCELLQHGPNDTYLLTTRDDRYILRVYGARWRSPSDIAYELELLNHLAASEVSVAVPIATHDGSLTRPLPAPEGTRQLVLSTYARGTPLSWEQEEHCYLTGQVTAMIHTASEGFVSRHVRFRLDLEYLIDTPLAAIRPFLAQRPEDRAYLDHLAGKMRVQAEAVVRTGLNWGLCHGDVSNGNIRVTEEHTFTVIDFDLCGPGWRVYDFVPAYRLGKYEKKNGIWDAFLKGYSQTRDVAALDLAALPLFHAISRLRSLGMRASIADFRGTLAMGVYLDSYLRFFREWEAEQPEGR